MSLLNFKSKKAVSVPKEPTEPPRSFKGVLDRLLKPTKDLITMWDTVYDEYISRDRPERGLVVSDLLYADTNFSYSSTDRVSAFYVCEELPPQMEIGFHTSLRAVLPPGVALNIIELNQPYTLNWNDASVKMRLSVLEDVAQDNRDRQEGTTTYSNHRFQKANERDAKLRQSIEYIQWATQASTTQRQLMQVRFFFVLTGHRTLEFGQALRDFERYCELRGGLRVRRVTSTIISELQDYSPFRLRVSDATLKKMNSQLASDELRARYHSFEQGVTGFGDVYIGTNVQTNSPVFKKFKRSATDAEIVLVLGGSDSGKSYLVKDILLQLGAFEDFVITINDYEGSEYALLGPLLEQDGVVTLDFAQGSARYVDLVPLFPTGIEDVDITLLSSVKGNLKKLFRALVSQKALSTRSWIETLIDNGIDAFYSSLGVSEDTATWLVTQGKSIYDLYDFLCGYQVKDESDIDAFLRERSYFIEALAPFLDRQRKTNSYFTEPVSLKELVEAKIVFCNYHMRGISAETLSDIDSLLVPLNAGMVAYYRTIYPYARGLYNVKVWEELPRFAKHPHAVSILKTHIVGGRKMGDVNIVATNDPKELVSDDPFALFDNYTMACVGKVGSRTTREKIMKEMDLWQYEDELEAIGRVVDDSDALAVSYAEIHANPYKKAFLTVMDSGDTVVLKVNLPSWLSETPLFKTGVNKSQSDEEED